MASIVAYIEVREGAITQPSLFAIRESRRIAQTAGATVYAFLPVGAISHGQIDQLAEQISAAGADRILCSSDESLAGPALDPTHGALLAQLAEHLRPLLFLFPAGGAGLALGPPLAIRIGAAYVPAASIEIHAAGHAAPGCTRFVLAAEEPSHRVLVTRWRAAGDGLRRIDVGDLERPVIAVLRAGVSGEGLGESYAEVEMLPCPTANRPECRVLRSEADSSAQVELCSTLVCVPAATTASDLDALRAELPAGVCVCSEADGALPRATPDAVLFVGLDPARFALRSTVVAAVSGSPGELALALRRLRTSDGEASR
jgi:hypothetical protein